MINYNTQQDFIKKAKINYLTCKQGSLHEGQVLNFICIDPNCKLKGLICPVCQSQSHSQHQTMHLKIFLSQIAKQLSNKSQSQNQISSITDHLRSIENSKKQMFAILKQTIQEIAVKVKYIQEKIQQTYVSAKKTILAQSSINTKLPKLYTLLTSNTNSQNESQIMQYIQKCSELLQYKNQKIYSIDSSQKIVNQFANLPSTISVHLSTVIPSITKLFDSLPIKLKKFSDKQQQSTKKQLSFQFSKTKKPSNVVLSQNLKSVEIQGEDIGGAIFIEKQLNMKQKMKVNFKIKESVSDSISLGIGNYESIRNKGFKMDESDIEMFGICSMGIVLNDFDSQSFVFSQGDIIQVEWIPEQTKIVFGRRNGIQKYEIFAQINQEQIKKFSFFVSLLVLGDKVQIVE